MALAAAGAALAYAVLERGGVDPGNWAVALLVAGVAGSVHFLLRLRQEIPPLDRIAGCAAFTFLFVVAIQIAPLPISLVRAIAPRRVELMQAVEGITGRSDRFVTLSAVPHETVLYLLTISAYLLMFLLIRDLSYRLADWPWAAVWPLLIIGTFEAGLGMVQVNAEGALGMATGTYASRDHYAGLLEMILPFAVVYALSTLQADRDTFDSRILPALKASLLLAAAAVMLVAIVLTLSRMGFLAALASLFVTGSLALSVRGWRVEYATEIPWWRRWLPTAGVAVVVLAGFIVLPTNPLIARFADLAQTDQISADTRAQIWRETAGMVKDYPVFGCGMGSFESCFLRYKTVAPMFTVDYAHNDYLQVLAETGMVGFLAGLVFVFRVAQKALKAVFYAQSIAERNLAIGCVASMTAILLHSFVDFNMYVPANGLMFAWIAGVAGVHLAGRRRQQHTEEGGFANP